MVAVAMSYYGFVNRCPGIDVEVALRAEEALIGEVDEQDFIFLDSPYTLQFPY